MSDFSGIKANLSSSVASLVQRFAEDRKNEPVINVAFIEDVETATEHEALNETYMKEQKKSEVILLENVDIEHHVEAGTDNHALSIEDLTHIANIPDVQLVEDFKTGEEDESSLPIEYVKDFDPSAGFNLKNVDLEVLHLPVEEEQYPSYADNSYETNTNVGEVIDGVYVIQEKQDTEDIHANYETRFQSGATELMSDLTSYNDDKDSTVQMGEDFSIPAPVEEVLDMPDMPDMTDFDPTRYFGIQQPERPTRPENLVEIVELEERRGTYDEAVEALSDADAAISASITEEPSMSLPEAKGNRSISEMLRELSSLKDQ